MLGRLALAVAASVVISAPRPVAANPITYDFTGALNQPIDGSNAFSGSITINATPTMPAGQSRVTARPLAAPKVVSSQ